jgi:hypothetical protein
MEIDSAKGVRVHVYRLPTKLNDGYCFDGGKPVPFANVDWFDATLDMPREELIEFIKSKRYYDPRARFLVLGTNPKLTFTIES